MRLKLEKMDKMERMQVTLGSVVAIGTRVCVGDPPISSGCMEAGPCASDVVTAALLCLDIAAPLRS